MAQDLTISRDEISAALRKYVEGFEPTMEREEVGRVTATGDGVANVEGLPRAMANELLEFPGGVLGIAFNLDVDSIGCIVLGEADAIEEGDPVKLTGRILSVPVGDGFLGRVIDPTGRPMDDKGPIKEVAFRVLEIQAPTVVERQPVKEPLQTGIMAIDGMTPIGRGQRELIIGDRQTGKTAIAVDTIINQRDNWATGDPQKQVKCIYVAMGQKNSTVAEVVAAFEQNGAIHLIGADSEAAAETITVYSIAPSSRSRS